jgi:hypothetical protein
MESGTIAWLSLVEGNMYVSKRNLLYCVCKVDGPAGTMHHQPTRGDWGTRDEDAP